MVSEPALSRSNKPGSVKGRWRWYYASIADYRLAHPGCTNKEVGQYVQRNENYISMIVNSDLYREYEAQRRAAWRRENDTVIRDKLTGLTIRAIDSMTEQFEKKKDQIPLDLAREVATSGLDRLGFGPKTEPQVVVNNNQQVVIPNAVSPAALEEARMALRAVEQRRMVAPPREVEAELLLSEDSSGLAESSEEVESRGVPRDDSPADS